MWEGCAPLVCRTCVQTSSSPSIWRMPIRCSRRRALRLGWTRAHGDGCPSWGCAGGDLPPHWSPDSCVWDSSSSEAPVPRLTCLFPHVHVLLREGCREKPTQRAAKTWTFTLRSIFPVLHAFFSSLLILSLSPVTVSSLC